MSVKSLLVYGSTDGSVPADTNPSPNSVPLRDADGGVTNKTSTAANQVSTGTEAGAVHATSTGAVTLDDTAYLWPCNATGGAFTVTLPPAGTCAGRRYCVKRLNSGSNAVTIDGNASEAIDGATTYALSAQYASAILMSDGTGWHVLAKV